MSSLVPETLRLVPCLRGHNPLACDKTVHEADREEGSMSAKRVVAWIVTGIVFGLVGLFVWQNGARLTDLHLELMVTRLATSQPIPVVALMGGSLGLGALIGAVGTMLLQAQRPRRAGAGSSDRERQDAWP